MTLPFSFNELSEPLQSAACCCANEKGSQPSKARPFSFKHLPKIDEVASFKAEGLEERENIGCIPSHRSEDFRDALFLVDFECFFIKPFSNPLSHEFGV